VIGIGGIYTAEDILAFMMAGATAVQIGTVNFNNPLAGKQLVEDLELLCAQEGIENIQEIIGII
jgi:dihydroorotate dehydrogenase (NAD+) catalytic subunit